MTQLLQAPPQAQPPRKKYRFKLIHGKYITSNDKGIYVPDPAGRKIRCRKCLGKGYDAQNEACPVCQGVGQEMMMILQDIEYESPMILARKGKGNPGDPVIIESDIDLATEFVNKFERVIDNGAESDRQAGETKHQYAQRLRALADAAMAADDTDISAAPVFDTMKDEELKRFAGEEEIDISKARNRKEVIDVLKRATKSK